MPNPFQSRTAGARLRRFGLLCAAVLLGAWLPPPTAAQPGDDVLVQAREAFRKKDRAALAAARDAIGQTRHPLAMWVAYWELNNRLAEAQQPELDSFYAQWPASYVEDRLRNDWLLELGKRRDWAHFRAEYPRFRMNDDREVTCYALVAEHLDGMDVRSAARAAWLAQRDIDDGCVLLSRTLFEAKVFDADDIWPLARQAAEVNRPRVARAAVSLLSPALGTATADLFDNPLRFLAGRPPGPPKVSQELVLLALMRLAASDPDAAAAQLDTTWGQRLPIALTATAWAHVARQAGLKLLPQAADHARRAWLFWDAAALPDVAPPWSNDLLAWHVRAALRQPASDKLRWALVRRAIAAMTPAEQREPTWVYWRSRALAASAEPGPEGDASLAEARHGLDSIATNLGFYGRLASEELGERPLFPLPPAAQSEPEREAARAHPGLARGLQLIALGLRSEGVREWNYSLRGMSDRELLAAAQWACEREVYDRCINTSERAQTEVDVSLRYPMPFRDQLVARAREAGLEPAVIYGLIRQESRFVADIRSAVGASGLMQLMPETARWTARKIGIEFRPERITDRDLNLRLGSAYFKRVLDNFGGSLTLATAAYNAGPGRPRRWRDNPSAIEPAAWAESIPFDETRDYVKKVLTNSVYYAALLGASNASGPAPAASLPDAPAVAAAPENPGLPLRARLGPAIGPREPSTVPTDRDLP
jgi:soluble lytic murein transglycosylase